jgi:hypothetical protein
VKESVNLSLRSLIQHLRRIPSRSKPMVPSINLDEEKDEDNLPMVKEGSMEWPSSTTFMVGMAREDG